MRKLTLSLTKKEWDSLRSAAWQALQVVNTVTELGVADDQDRAEAAALVKLLDELKEVGDQETYFGPLHEQELSR